MNQGRRPARGRPGALVALVVPALAVPVLVSALVVFVHAPALAGSSGTDDYWAVELVRKSATAADRVSYTGTQYVSTWSALTTSSSASSAVIAVEHQAGGSTEFRVQNRQSTVLQGHDATSWLAGDGPAELVVRSYDINLGGQAQVAGRVADVVEARRSDGSLAARLWLDHETGLSLRREAYGVEGHLLSASSFVDIEIRDDECCQVGGSLPTPATTQGTEDATLRWSDIERLRDQGWHCPERLDDGMVLYEARSLGEAVQLSYSDGVMTVSVFEQPGQLDLDELDDYTLTERAAGAVYTTPGPPAKLTWSSGDQVITVVAEAPLSVVDPLLEKLPPDVRPEADNGVLARIGRGAQRVGSWFNPFG